MNWEDRGMIQWYAVRCSAGETEKNHDFNRDSLPQDGILTEMTVTLITILRNRMT